MTDWEMYLWVTGGVVVAVISPVLSGFIRKEFPPTAAIGLPVWAKKYGGLLLFSLITGLLCLAMWRAANPTATIEWHTAFLLGFGWESAIEKFQKKT